MMEAQIEFELLSVVERCRGLGVPSAELDEMVSLVKAGEGAIALENLCTQLFEYDSVVSAPVFELISKLGRAMEIEAKYWDRLRLAE